MSTASLKVFYQQLRARHPMLADYAARVYRGGLLRTVSRRTKGPGHRIDIHRSAILKNVTIEFLGSGHCLIIGPHCLLRNVRFYVCGSNNSIALQERVQFNHGGSFWMEDKDGEIMIGQGTTFENSQLAVTGKGKRIKIGQGCMFAYDIEIRTGDSHAVVDLAGQKINHEKDVTIGDHVWVAAHCSILKGSQIPSDSIVATRSTITRSFETRNTLLGGSPAKVLKEHLSWTRERYPND